MSFVHIYSIFFPTYSNFSCVTIKLSSFISYIEWWTYIKRICIHLTPSMKLMTELIQCKYDLPFRLTVSNMVKDVDDKGEEKKTTWTTLVRSPLYSHYYSNRSNITWRIYYAYSFFFSLSLSFSSSFPICHIYIEGVWTKKKKKEGVIVLKEKKSADNERGWMNVFYVHTCVCADMPWQTDDFMASKNRSNLIEICLFILPFVREDEALASVASDILAIIRPLATTSSNLS